MKNDDLDVLLEMANDGRSKWLDLVEKYNISYDTMVYIMPHEKEAINEKFNPPAMLGRLG